jgi:hypothetical protein
MVAIIAMPATANADVTRDAQASACGIQNVSAGSDPTTGVGWYYIKASFSCQWRGHWHFWGPGLGGDTDDQYWQAGEFSSKFHGRGHGTACAEAWWPHPNGSYLSLGRRCVSVG